MNIKISKSVLFAMLAVILAIGAYWANSAQPAKNVKLA